VLIGFYFYVDSGILKVGIIGLEIGFGVNKFVGLELLSGF
jgi:hypothetical protein